MHAPVCHKRSVTHEPTLCAPPNIGPILILVLCLNTSVYTKDGTASDHYCIKYHGEFGGSYLTTTRPLLHCSINGTAVYQQSRIKQQAAQLETKSQHAWTGELTSWYI